MRLTLRRGGKVLLQQTIIGTSPGIIGQAAWQLYARAWNELREAPAGTSLDVDDGDADNTRANKSRQRSSR